MVFLLQYGVGRDRHGDDVDGQWGVLGHVVLCSVWGESAVSVLGLIRSHAVGSNVGTRPGEMHVLGDCSPPLFDIAE